MYAINMRTLDICKQWCLGTIVKHIELVITPDYFDYLDIDPTIADMALMGNPTPLMSFLMATAKKDYEIDTLNSLINCKLKITKTIDGNLKISNF